MVCPRENVSFAGSDRKRLRPSEGQRLVWADRRFSWLSGESVVA